MLLKAYSANTHKIEGLCSTLINCLGLRKYGVIHLIVLVVIYPLHVCMQIHVSGSTTGHWYGSEIYINICGFLYMELVHFKAASRIRSINPDFERASGRPLHRLMNGTTGVENAKANARLHDLKRRNNTLTC